MTTTTAALLTTLLMSATAACSPVKHLERSVETYGAIEIEASDVLVQFRPLPDLDAVAAACIKHVPEAERANWRAPCACTVSAGKIARVYFVPPETWSAWEHPALITLGHEFLHAAGAKHKRAVVGGCVPHQR